MSAVAAADAPQAKFVQPAPFRVDLEPGKDYFYCTCGYSKNQPFCDGSHRAAFPDGSFKSKKFSVTEAKTYSICGCKQTDNAPFCDGTHRKEKGVKKYNEFLLKENTKIKDQVKELEARVKTLSYVAVAVGVFGVAGVVLSRVLNK
ncbi:hypothetical protein HDV05_000107 [Chytridiales sp. JEL 0842]|nr:hypothetical protein HDV05_000107 [Chytridiales sp. JEL 0842]